MANVVEKSDNTSRLIAKASECLATVKGCMESISLRILSIDSACAMTAASAACTAIDQLKQLISLESCCAVGILYRRNEVMAAEAAEAEKIKAAKVPNANIWMCI